MARARPRARAEAMQTADVPRRVLGTGQVAGRPEETAAAALARHAGPAPGGIVLAVARAPDRVAPPVATAGAASARALQIARAPGVPDVAPALPRALGAVIAAPAARTDPRAVGGGAAPGAGAGPGAVGPREPRQARASPPGRDTEHARVRAIAAGETRRAGVAGLARPVGVARARAVAGVARPVATADRGPPGVRAGPVAVRTAVAGFAGAGRVCGAQAVPGAGPLCPPGALCCAGGVDCEGAPAQGAVTAAREAVACAVATADATQATVTRDLAPAERAVQSST